MLCVRSVSRSCPALCDPMHCHPTRSSVHEISQARILEWVAISFSRGSSQPRDQTIVSCIGSWVLYYWATWEASLITQFLTSVLPVVCIEPGLLTISGLWPYTAWVCFHLADSGGASRFCSSLLAFGEHFWTTHDELATSSTALLCIPIIPIAPPLVSPHLTMRSWGQGQSLSLPWVSCLIFGGPWIVTGRTDAEAKVPILWPPDVKSWCWQRLRAGR